MRAVGRSVGSDDMALNALGLGLEIGWHDRGAIPGLQKLGAEYQRAQQIVGDGSRNMGAQVDGLNSALGDLAAGAATVGIGVGIAAAPFALATQMAGPFQDALAQLRAISGATAEQMGALGDAAINAGIATQFDPTQAALALSDLAAAGFNVNESLSLLSPTLNLAAGSLGQLSPSDAAGLASQAMKAFGVEVQDAGMAVDQMLASVNVFALAAKDLPLALGTAARGAGTLNQSLDETLVTLGLVKNVVPGVERASTAVSTAMEKMADPKVQKALKGLGVEAVDSAGNFRPFLDIVGDMIPGLEKMTAAKRSAFLIDTFGTEALTGFNAIMGQVTKGIPGANGQILKGADAVAYLRDQFKNAGGTAEKFSQELLKDLPGQIRLLKGSLSTLGVVVGQALAQAFQPAVKGAVEWINKLIVFFREMPAPMQVAIARIVAITTAFIGATIALQGLRQMVGPALMFLKTAIAGLGGTGIAIIAGLVLAIVGFKAAIDANLGGIGDAFRSVVAKVSLAYNALTQLFTQGGFSGAVRKAFESAENDGVRAFAIQVYLWVNRIGNFLSNLGKGFSAVIDQASPTFDRFVAALGRMAEAFGMSLDGPKKAGSAFDTFGRVGVRVGTAIANALVLVVDYLTTVINYWAGVKSSISSSEFIKPLSAAFNLLGESISTIMTALGSFNVTLSSTGTAAGSIGSLIGNVLVFFIRSAANVVQSLAVMFANLATAFSGAVNLIVGLLTGNWSRAWLGAKQIVFAVISGIVDTFGGLIQFVANGLDALSKLGGNTTNYAQGVADWRTSVREGMAESFGVDQAGQAAATTPAAPMTAQSAISVPPAAMSGGIASDAGLGTVAKTLAAAIEKINPRTGAAQPLYVMIDGQVVATAVAGANDDNASRSFTPQVPE